MAAEPLPDQGPISVYLLGGQSNMVGSAYLVDLPTDLYTIPEILLYVGAARFIKDDLADTLIPLQVHSTGSRGDTMDPSIGFGERMRELCPSEHIALIKYAYIGSSLKSDWYPGANAADTANWGNRFTIFVNTVNSGLAALEAAGWEPEIKGMLWHQGEADAGAKWAYASAYGANLSLFIGRVREQFIDIEGTEYPVWVVQRDLGAANVVMKGYYSTDLIDWESNIPELYSYVRGANGIATLTFRSPLSLKTDALSKGFFRVGVE